MKLLWFSIFLKFPYIHIYILFLWIINAPLLTGKTTESYTEWSDQMISAELPDEDSEQTFKNYQLHRHLRHARNTGMENVDLILVDFLQKEL